MNGIFLSSDLPDDAEEPVSDALVEFVTSVGAHLKGEAPDPPDPPTQVAPDAQAIRELVTACHAHPEQFSELALTIGRSRIREAILSVRHDNHVTLDLEACYELLRSLFDQAVKLKMDDVAAEALIVLASNRRFVGFLSQAEIYGREALNYARDAASIRLQQLALFEIAMIRCGIDEVSYLHRAQSLPDSDEEEELTTAKLLYAQSLSACQRNDLPASAELITESIGQYQKAGDEYGRARALVQLGVYTRLSGELDEANKILSNALDIGRGRKYPRVEAIALLELGRVATAQGCDDEAKSKLGSALRLSQRIKWQIGEAHSLSILATLDRRIGTIERATEQARAACDLYFKCDDRAERGPSLATGLALRRLGECLRDAGVVDEAEEVLDRSISVFTVLQNPDGLGVALASKAKLLDAKGEREAALNVALEGLQLIGQMPGRSWQGNDASARPHEWCYRTAANLAIACGEMATAQRIAAASQRDLELRRLRFELAQRPDEVGQLVQKLVDIERRMRPTACDSPAAAARLPDKAVQSMATERTNVLRTLSDYDAKIASAFADEGMRFVRLYGTQHQLVGSWW